MPETFDSIHIEDLGEVAGYVKRGDSNPPDSKVVAMFAEFTNVQAEQAGIVDGFPVRVYYPSSVHARETAWRRRLIEIGRMHDRNRD